MSKPTVSNPEINHVTVYWGESWAACAEIDEYALRMENNPIHERSERDPRRQAMLRQIVVDLLEVHANELTYRTPATWWQMFKRDRFPLWALRRWPVQEHIERVVIKDLFPFPTVKYPPPELGPEIRIVRMERIPFSNSNPVRRKPDGSNPC